MIVFPSSWCSISSSSFPFCLELFFSACFYDRPVGDKLCFIWECLNFLFKRIFLLAIKSWVDSSFLSALGHFYATYSWLSCYLERKSIVKLFFFYKKYCFSLVKLFTYFRNFLMMCYGVDCLVFILFGFAQGIEPLCFCLLLNSGNFHPLLLIFSDPVIFF